MRVKRGLMSNFTYFYVHRLSAAVLLIEKNPCGCCPADYLFERSNRFNDRWTSSMTASELGRYLDTRGYDYLDKWKNKD